MFVDDLYKNTEGSSLGMQQIWQKIAVFEHKPFCGGSLEVNWAIRVIF